MTLAGVERERARIVLLSGRRTRSPRSPAVVALLSQSQAVGAGAGPGAAAAPHFDPGQVLVVPRNGVGTFVVLDGQGAELTVFDPDIITIEPSSFLDWAPAPPDKAIVIRDSQSFNAVSKGKLGQTQVRLKTAGDLVDLIIVVSPFPAPPVFHPSTPHNHSPCGHWDKIQANPNSDAISGSLCAMSDDPQKVIDSVKLVMAKAPLAIQHLDWYLSKGSGKDFNEDLNILNWLHQDSHIRARLKKEIFPAGRKPRSEGHFEFSRDDFDTSKTENFALSFGSIDRVDFAVDFADDIFRVWFIVRYEFHPVFPGLYSVQPGDLIRGKPRGDNCIHAAAVEMKNRGARDDWMKGQAEAPLSLIAGP